jgi:septal ring factor EnvC (AmiA/AmiB activator)
MRSEYEQVSGEFASYKKQHETTMSPSTSTTLPARLNLSPFGSTATGTATSGSTTSSIAVSNSSYQQNQQQQQQENESLEEDMRKAKESADMLRSVVLPLETEISTLRTRSNTSDMRIKELQRQLEEVSHCVKRG